MVLFRDRRKIRRRRLVASKDVPLRRNLPHRFKRIGKKRLAAKVEERLARQP